MLLIGWDAADWKAIQPLLDAGEMPHLARLITSGVRGNIATIYPVLSPMLWTSIATGKRANKHGIHGFSEPLPDNSGVRPITLLSRKTKAMWNILNQNGHRSIVAGWWPSHPAEPINGVMVSNYFLHPAQSDGPQPLPSSTIHPASLAPALAELRVNPMELTGEFIRPFVPEYDKVDQAKDKRLHSLGKIIAETMSLHAVATELLETQPWDFAAVYYSGIDHFGHGFMKYHPPRLPWVSEADFEIYQHVIANAYRYHDAMLGVLLRFADERTTVILLSDHGFHPDHLRPGYIPAEPAGPAVEHRHFGILCMKGPALRVNEQLFGASVLDICPTVLSLFNLPPGKDMDGKVLLTAFKEGAAPRIDPIESWDQVAGDAGIHAPETRLDPVASAQAFQQLVDLGYVAPPGPDVQETIAECTRELKYNLARACRDGGSCGEAAALAEELWARWPKEHRFGILLIECLGALRQVERRRNAIEELRRRVERYQAESRAELARRKEQSQAKDADGKDEAPGPEKPRRAHFEERQLRELAHGRPVLLDWFDLSQALLEKKPAAARQLLEKLAGAEGLSGTMSHRIANALTGLGNLEEARGLLESALQSDPENPFVHAQLAAIHSRAGRFDQTIAAAVESLSLLYFQPGMHALLGQALMETGRFSEAEQELQVAVAQSPRNLAAHDLLGRLYREHLNRPIDAFAHEGRAQSLRNELAAQQRTNGSSPGDLGIDPAPVETPNLSITEKAAVPPPFGAEVNARRVITIVSGLPRSGTSMMMQILSAGGCEVLTDSKRGADEDNPFGYLEFEKTLDLAKDASWLPQARGKAVKVVAQLLPCLPSDEHYHVIFMERNLDEVIASQAAMLERQGRHGANLNARELRETYATQLRRLREYLAHRPAIRILSVNYAELLANPGAGVERIAQFLGGPFNRQAAMEAVRPGLRRQGIGPLKS